ncbi:MAG: hypothetical protein GXO87_09605 [Chlorobi bacterium]|nr:hypothetical protein [Chlorobiota bacterium]
MKSIQKFALPALVVVIVGLIYFEYFAPKSELGDFSKFGDSEINQRINVLVVKDKDFGRNENGDIISFSAKDKKNKIVFVSLREPAPEGFENAVIVELLGHMHGDNFTAAGIKIIK